MIFKIQGLYKNFKIFLQVNYHLLENVVSGSIGNIVHCPEREQAFAIQGIFPSHFLFAIYESTIKFLLLNNTQAMKNYLSLCHCFLSLMN